ncbi:D-alanyl-lipoteichoic acid biosynthesis protein DltD [Pediococcus ethanolidurans]|uniref:D-alanyl-lipoteichoic acid biosynthesis protein DltD n=1 Tax=Pediococcus ethanolidurans TaxID=319653 RepID=UPI001C1EEB74|nr:D-alanyl-lipoteichoic acid biosynthesis protein DltD [Pediococcus ethanolidurans]MBU7554301.1 D-alanyl-lipoteichoic acid biosynthesis protein DltD [Pediococcus ethanolidurans]MBU7562535.1 D-alanyl-lipoteichoic acid biosynthesis protein DltD [Pediococcus ethanolidurans]MCT4397370.1 D-alanyl-lipoteichoic acid biosynthesis protein DltD [Pediococcus ethanolidurans]MCV3321182.1 D-alanyl-lipoteichoic acid biosynthesis protein DltD [Pediococcus ethanolidurans]MCV3323069.1 D-alanyl-lipoteichoic aci
MAKKLFLIFGPVVFAALLLFALLFSPFKLNHITAKTENKAALALSPNVLKGQVIKESALSHEKFVPFFGSSEFSRFDFSHPSVLATKYNRSYTPFLMGAPGTQSLTHYFQMQLITSQMKNRKAVFVISPQWFVKKGARKDAFGFYYSPLQSTTWLLDRKQNNATDRYAAQRLLDMPSGNANHTIMMALRRVAKGQKITHQQRTYMIYEQRLLQHEDQLFSALKIKNNQRKIDRLTKQLPEHYQLHELNQLAVKQGEKHTTNNRFGIDNRFYARRLRSKEKKFKNFEQNWTYTQSPEFSDFELVLDQFAASDTNVEFIIPPVNEKWSKYTGLSTKMLKQFDQKIRYQLTSQGFTNICDLSDKGDVPYFMQDTIHLGWRGWLAADQAIDPFLTQKQTTPTYHMNNKFYSKEWQNQLKVKN